MFPIYILPTRGPRDGARRPRTVLVPIRPWDKRGRGRFFQIQMGRGQDEDEIGMRIALALKIKEPILIVLVF